MQSKTQADAIENTIKRTKGKPSASEMKLLEQSKVLINGFRNALQARGKELKDDMMDWRSSWNKTCAEVVFDNHMLESMMAYRKQVIDKQAKEWNAAAERVGQYVVRADTLISSVANAAKDAPSSGGAESLEKLKAAHTASMQAGPKQVGDYISEVNTSLAKWKADAKNGIDPRDKANAAKIWESKSAKVAQFPAYAKSFSGASKTLGILLNSVATGSKAADKASAGEWAQLKTAIEADIKSVDKAAKECAELIKVADKVAENYKKAIKG